MLVSVSRTLAQRLKTCCKIKLVFRWRLHDSIHILLLIFLCDLVQLQLLHLLYPVLHMVAIVDELVNRDKRIKSIIVYNLLEATDHAASFLTLCKTVFDLDILVT